ncbi:MAG: polysaccharide deacetylase family protein [Kiloniellaceae bacterium]
MTGGWTALEREFDAWAQSDREALVWWRDDDAAGPSKSLTRLLDLAADCAAPLSLAVIPAKAEPGLVNLLANHPADATVLQHGFAHSNHAAAGAKKCELTSPSQRPAVTEELRLGRTRLSTLFGARSRPFLVPPWNRLASDLAARLPEIGFIGLSTYQPRLRATAVPGLVQVNCHVDIMQWRPERRFLGTAAALDLLIGHLSAKRRGDADPDEPSGILSHHLVHDDDAWDFLGRLLRRLARHPAVRLLPAAAVFTSDPGTKEAAGC